MNNNQVYFTSYEDLEVHRLMLEDSARTEGYKKAIQYNKEYFKDKVVMDVGCGTGILSLFCAQAGAMKVYAVEASNIAIIAKEIVKDNGFEDTIEVIHSKVEDIELPNNIKVDVIVSEWMGFYLLHEGMLDSVLLARDNFLKQDGKLFPDTAAIYVAPCSVPSFYQQWEEFHGISMSGFAKYLKLQKLNKPEIMQVQPEHLLGDPVLLAWINLQECNISDLETFNIQHVVGMNKDGKYQGLCVWFDCQFPQLSEGFEQVTLSTNPSSPSTHWKQTVILLPMEQVVEKGEPVAFELDMFKDKETERRYTFRLTMLDPNDVDHPVPCSCDRTTCILTQAVMMNYARSNYTNNLLEEEEINDEE